MLSREKGWRRVIGMLSRRMLSHTCTPVFIYLHVVYIYTTYTTYKSNEQGQEGRSRRRGVWSWWSRRRGFVSSWGVVSWSRRTSEPTKECRCASGTHLWMSHDTCMIESWHVYEWVMAHVWMQMCVRYTPMDEACLCDWVMARVWMSYGTCMIESWHIYECVMAAICMGDVRCINQSRHVVHRTVNT